MKVSVIGTVVVLDPQATETARRRSPDLVHAESVSEACTGADLVLVLTEWTQLRMMDPGVVASRVRRRNVIDGRNVLDVSQWRDAGWQLRALGRSA